MFHTILQGYLSTVHVPHYPSRISDHSDTRQLLYFTENKQSSYCAMRYEIRISTTYVPESVKHSNQRMEIKNSKLEHCTT